METDHHIFFRSATGLPGIETETVDLVVTSPPYPMIEMWDHLFGEQDPRVADAISAEKGPAAYELMHRILDGVWAECFRVVKPGGFLCINIGDATRTIGENFRLYTNHSRITVRCEALGFQSLPTVLWQKPTNGPNKFMGSGMLPSGAYVTLEHEYVLVFRKGDKRRFTGDDRERRRESAFFWEERNVWFSDRWDFKGMRQGLSTNDSRSRSGAFPFELPFRLIHMYSLQEDLVLDPFAGTGTTMAAAMAAGRNSIGIEIDAALADTIARTVQELTPMMDERQHQRIEAHHAFVEEYRTERKKPLKHRNAVHDFPVMTSQEKNLSIPVVASVTRMQNVARTDSLDYRVTHRIYTPDAQKVPETDWTTGQLSFTMEL